MQACSCTYVYDVFVFVRPTDNMHQPWLCRAVQPHEHLYRLFSRLQEDGIRAGSRKKKQIFSAANVHAGFSIQIVKLCTSLLCDIAKTSPVVFFFVFLLSDFSSVKIFVETVAHLRPNFFGERKKSKRRSGLGMGM